MAYVCNAVAIPRIEYKTQLTVFNELEASKLTSKLRQNLKHKIGLPSTAPNEILELKDTFNHIDFFKRQLSNHVNNLHIKLNANGPLGLSTEIRLRQLQWNEWLYASPLEIWNYDNVNSFKSNLIAQVLCIMNTYGLNFSTPNDADKYVITPRGFPVSFLLNDNYRCFR